MKKKSTVIESILDDLNVLELSSMASRLGELYQSPDFLNMTPLELVREIVTPEVECKTASRLEWRLKRAHLTGCPADLARCVNSVERKYEPHGITDVLSSMDFVSSGTNVCVFGASGSGKSYYAKALCVQACSTGNAVYYHCSDLLDELAMHKNQDFASYRKQFSKLLRLPLIVLDDFLLERAPDDSQYHILFSILEGRKEALHSTIVCSQRRPEGWHRMIGDEALADSIQTRATSGYVMEIQLTNSER